MSDAQGHEGILSPYRVLDLTNEMGQLCGLLLAGMGADVIKVEPPGGDPSRQLGPFYHNEVDPEKSLHWFMFNRGKRSITLDITKPQGAALLRRLVERSDFFLETFRPGYLDSLGLGYSALSRINPSLVMTSITPFGQTGPYHEYRATDIVGFAMGGHMYLNGEEERGPVRPSVNSAYAQASVQAAAGTLIAHYCRNSTGQGQHVDVSMQEAVSVALDTTPQTWDLLKINNRRPDVGRFVGGRKVGRYIYPAKDGHILALGYGGITGRSYQDMVDWLDSEGMAADLKEEHWRQKLTAPMGATTLTPEEEEHLENVVMEFTRRHNREELVEEAHRRGIWWGLVLSPKEIVENKQLRSRNFWEQLEHPELGDTITYPGAPFRFSETPWRIDRRAPRIGEHNVEVYQEELGMAQEEVNALRHAGVI